MSSNGAEQRYIFTTLRYDPALRDDPTNTAASDGHQSPIYLVNHHLRRLDEAAKALYGHDYEAPHACRSPFHLERLVEGAIQEWSGVNHASQPDYSGPSRVRLAFSPNDDVDIDCPRIAQTIPILFPASLDDHGSPTWTVCLDVHSTQRNVHTSYKTFDRRPYNQARATAGCTLAGTKEVLLYNTNGQIMDASIMTPYFYRNGRWVTPPHSAGGQQGTTRRWAMTNELCVEADVSVESLREGEVLWLSNAARGFFAATFIPQSSDIGNAT